MTQRDYAIKWLFFSLAALILVALQTLVLRHITIWSIHPILYPMIVALATMWEGRQGVLFSMVFGLLMDLTTTGPIPCFYTLTFFMISVATILVVKHLIVPGFVCAIITSILSIFLCDLLQILFLSYKSGISLPPALLLTAKEEISVVCMPLIYFPFRALHNRAQAD